MRSQLWGLMSGYSSSSSSTQTYPGSIVTKVDQDFLQYYGIGPKDRHAKTKKSVVQGLYYCRSELDISGVESSLRACNPQDCFGLPPRRGGVNHDYLVIEFCLEGFSERFFLRGEKVVDRDSMNAGSPPDCGIRIDLLPPSTNFKKNILFEVHGPVQIDLGEVIAALESHSTNYNLVNDNCWNYAVEAGQDVLDTLAKADGASPCVKEKYSLDLSATTQKLFQEEFPNIPAAVIQQASTAVRRKFTGNQDGPPEAGNTE